MRFWNGPGARPVCSRLLPGCSRCNSVPGGPGLIQSQSCDFSDVVPRLSRGRPGVVPGWSWGGVGEAKMVPRQCEPDVSLRWSRNPSGVLPGCSLGATGRPRGGPRKTAIVPGYPRDCAGLSRGGLGASWWCRDVDGHGIIPGRPRRHSGVTHKSKGSQDIPWIILGCRRRPGLSPGCPIVVAGWPNGGPKPPKRFAW